MSRKINHDSAQFDDPKLPQSCGFFVAALNDQKSKEARPCGAQQEVSGGAVALISDPLIKQKIYT
jgi:hypothetical protein